MVLRTYSVSTITPPLTSNKKILTLSGHKSMAMMCVVLGVPDVPSSPRFRLCHVTINIQDILEKSY